jgi:hypothetical protein
VYTSGYSDRVVRVDLQIQTKKKKESPSVQSVLDTIDTQHISFDHLVPSTHFTVHQSAMGFADLLTDAGLAGKFCAGCFRVRLC